MMRAHRRRPAPAGRPARRSPRARRRSTTGARATRAARARPTRRPAARTVDADREVPLGLAVRDVAEVELGRPGSRRPDPCPRPSARAPSPPAAHRAAAAGSPHRRRCHHPASATTAVLRDARDRRPRTSSTDLVRDHEDARGPPLQHHAVDATQPMRRATWSTAPQCRRSRSIGPRREPCADLAVQAVALPRLHRDVTRERVEQREVAVRVVHDLPVEVLAPPRHRRDRSPRARRGHRRARPASGTARARRAAGLRRSPRTPPGSPRRTGRHRPGTRASHPSTRGDHRAAALPTRCCKRIVRVDPVPRGRREDQVERRVGRRGPGLEVRPDHVDARVLLAGSGARPRRGLRPARRTRCGSRARRGGASPSRSRSRSRAACRPGCRWASCTRASKSSAGYSGARRR